MGLSIIPEDPNDRSREIAVHGGFPSPHNRMRPDRHFCHAQVSDLSFSSDLTSVTRLIGGKIEFEHVDVWLAWKSQLSNEEQSYGRKTSRLARRNNDEIARTDN